MYPLLYKLDTNTVNAQLVEFPAITVKPMSSGRGINAE